MRRLLIISALLLSLLGNLSFARAQQDDTPSRTYTGGRSHQHHIHKKPTPKPSPVHPLTPRPKATPTVKPKKKVTKKNTKPAGKSKTKSGHEKKKSK